MSAAYDRKTKYVTIKDASGQIELMQKCRSIAEARKIARQYGITL
jgi:hypothetical protein